MLFAQGGQGGSQVPGVVRSRVGVDQPAQFHHGGAWGTQPVLVDVSQGQAHHDRIGG
jgi:hypothetical protein